MLKTKSSFDNSLTEKIEINEYNPITILWGSSLELENGYLSGLHQYWSLRSPNTLVEIGLDVDTHGIRIVKIPLTMNFSKSEVNIDSDKKREIGLPVCDISGWELSGYQTDYYFQEEGEFILSVGKDNVRVSFSEEKIDCKMIVDRVWFGIDENRFLCKIGIDRLTEIEMEKLINTLEYQRIY